MGTEILGASDRLLAAVINGIYQGTLLTALVALSFRLCRRTNAATRHAVWLCALVLSFLLVVAHCLFQAPPRDVQLGQITSTAATPEPAMRTSTASRASASTDGLSPETGIAGPKWRGSLPAEQGQPASQISDDARSLTSAELPDEVVPFSAGSSPSPGTALQGSEANGLSIAFEPLGASAPQLPASRFSAAIQRLVKPASLTLGLESHAARIASGVLLSVCLVLSAARLCLLLLRLGQIRRLKLQSFPADEALNELFQSLVARLGIRRKVDLKTLPTAPSSLVLGFLHPVILLATEQIERTETEQVLYHELAHVRRRDDWANLLQHFILAVVPFHPAVWWISRRLSLEREIACDDYVLQSKAHPHAYALLLANLAARMQRGPSLLAPGASTNKTQLQQRIDMILHTHRNTSPRLAAARLTFMASAAALFAVTAIGLAPRIVLAQSEAAPAAPKSPDFLIEDPIQDAPAVASVAASVSPEAGEAAFDDAPSPTPEPAAIGPRPKWKTGHSSPVNGQLAVAPAPAVPAAPGAPSALSAPRAPQMLPGPIVASADEPRPGRTPRPARAGSPDASLEERLERLEKMVESLMARGYATPRPYPLKPSPDMVGPMKEIEKDWAEIARKRELGEKERIRDQAKREAARAAEQAKRAAMNADRAARAEQKRQTRRGFKEASQKQLDELHKRLEMLDREKEKLEREIEDLERQRDQQDEQGEEDVSNDAQSHEVESNSDLIQTSPQ